MLYEGKACKTIKERNDTGLRACLKIEKVPDFCLGRGGFKAETARQAVACRGFPTQKTHVLDKKTVFAIFQTSPKELFVKSSLKIFKNFCVPQSQVKRFVCGNRVQHGTASVSAEKSSAAKNSRSRFPRPGCSSMLLFVGKLGQGFQVPAV